MKLFLQLVGVFAAVMLGIVGAHIWNQYADTHVNLYIQPVLDSATMKPTQDVSVGLSPDLLHQASGIHLYMIPLIKQKDADGYWSQKYGTDAQVQEDSQFVAFTDKGNNYVTQYVIVCTTQKLTTYKQVWDASWNKYIHNSMFFQPDDVSTGNYSLQSLGRNPHAF